jgi:hypothetical protein
MLIAYKPPAVGLGLLIPIPGNLASDHRGAPAGSAMIGCE